MGWRLAKSNCVGKVMDWKITKEIISAQTPAADAVVKSSHQVIGRILCAVLHGTMVKQRLSWKLPLMMHVSLPHMLCILFQTLPYREWLLEHWYLDVT